MSTLQEWTDQLAAELGLTEPVDVGLVLDLARDAAHGVARPAAPLTAFMVGLAAGRDGLDAPALRGLVARVSGLAGTWPGKPSQSSQSGETPAAAAEAEPPRRGDPGPDVMGSPHD